MPTHSGSLRTVGTYRQQRAHLSPGAFSTSTVTASGACGSPTWSARSETLKSIGKCARWASSSAPTGPVAVITTRAPSELPMTLALRCASSAAFGFLDAVDIPFKPVVLASIAVGALAGLAWYAATLDPAQKLTRIGLAFVIGGAIGNLIDRVTAGYVLDFVDLYQGGWHFWAFNVADAAINVGVALMILELLPFRRSAAHPERVEGSG